MITAHVHGFCFGVSDGAFVINQVGNKFTPPQGASDPNLTPLSCPARKDIRVRALQPIVHAQCRPRHRRICTVALSYPRCGRLTQYIQHRQSEPRRRLTLLSQHATIDRHDVAGNEAGLF